MEKALQEAVVIVDMLKVASEVAFCLAREVGSATGRAIVDLALVDRIHPDLLRQFREAWTAARDRAFGPDVEPRPVVVTYSVVGIVEPFFDPRRYLQTDPTSGRMLNISDLHYLACRWTWVARCIGQRAEQRKGMLEANRGTDPDAFAAELIQEYKVSPRFLSEIVETYLTPTVELSAQKLMLARAQEDRWYKRIKRQSGAQGKVHAKP